MHWIIIGAGNFLGDILDTIDSNQDTAELVLNQSVDVNFHGKITQLKNYTLNPEANHFFGFIDPNKDKLLKQLSGAKFGNLIHSHAYVSKTATLGVGNYIGPGSVIGPNVEMKDFNYINRCVSLGHNTSLGSFNTINPGATICGRCKIGSEIYIGAAASIRDGVMVVDKVTLGMGGVATKHLKESGTYLGIPAKKI